MNNFSLKQLKNKPFFTYTFLAIQALVFLVAYLFPALQVEFRGSMIGPLIVFNQEYWRFFTPVFIHFGLMHFAVNSVVLYFMGQQVEAIYGHVRFFFIYMLTAFSGNLLSFAFNTIGIQSAGSSTALFGLFGAFVILGMHFKDNPAIQAMVRQFGLFVGMSFLFGLFGQSIDIWGHLGGFLGGLLLGNVLGLPKRSRQYSIHVRIISGLLLLFLVIFSFLYAFRKYGLI